MFKKAMRKYFWDYIRFIHSNRDNINDYNRILAVLADYCFYKYCFEKYESTLGSIHIFPFSLLYVCQL